MARNMAIVPDMPRRQYRTGSVYQRSKDGLWVGTLEAGWTERGTRRRITVSGPTEAAVKKKLRDRAKDIARHGLPAEGGSMTLKVWAEEWLAAKQNDLRPKAFASYRSAVRKWIIPTIGRKQLDQLTPGDIRALATAHRTAGVSSTMAASTHRILRVMLKDAIIEGHSVPQRLLLIKAPKPAKSDRMDLSVNESLACLRIAADLPHGTRWAVALLYGCRRGECLGLTWDAVDFERGEICIEWQLQALPYVDRKRPKLGFRVPDGFEARHLVDAHHLVRPKSQSGLRVLPLVPYMREALLRWREIAPANPWGLVWPTTGGRPANDKLDLEEWHAVQGAASLVDYEPATELGPVQVGHPAGRYYHVHECRNVTATALGEERVDGMVITSLLGHASLATSQGYMRVHDAPKREAVGLLAARLGLAGG